METVTTIDAIRDRVTGWRRAGQRVAFVPTMGNLHAGHLALVTEARRHAERVVVSIFVNPLQFGAGEDLAAYPRTEDEDARRLAEVGADLLFLPQEREVYPHGRECITRVEVPEVSEGLCGASRPGHFAGVATVVAKLLNIVAPDCAVFGQKDYQQLLVIRRMVRDLDFPVTVVGLPTIREPDGLAMSSRNGYLSREERARAPALYRELGRLAAAVRAGRRDWPALEREAAAGLASAGLRPDYISIRRADDLGPALPDVPLIVLGSAWLGRARLIDNLLIENS